MVERSIAELITQRRKQVLVHSIMYYRLGESIVSDETWNSWARELYELQKEYPDLASQCFLAEEFKDFDPCSGYYLPVIPWAVEKAKQLLKWRNLYANS